jgi:hypothetical protein
MQNTGPEGARAERVRKGMRDLGAGRDEIALSRHDDVLAIGNARGSDSHVLRPMITAWPVVSARKRFKSSGSRQGRRLSAPMTPFAATAAMSASSNDVDEVEARLFLQWIFPPSGRLRPGGCHNYRKL